MLDIAGGHFMAAFLYALGNPVFSSITATTGIAFPTISIISNTGETLRTIPAVVPDQISFSGTLDELNAIASFHFRGGLKSNPGRAGLIWVIDGEAGSIKLEGPTILVNNSEPKLYLNGELIEVGDTDSITGLWTAFAGGKTGTYMVIEEAVAVKKVLAAVTRSAVEGRRVDL